MQPIKIDKQDIQGESPRAAYAHLVTLGKISYDAAQEKIAALLSNLSEELFNYQPLMSLLKKIMGRGNKLNKQGLYIYGEVGRGKTMLMDLFFKTVENPKKKRVHFNSFMLEIHEKIFNWRNEHQEKARNKDPIPAIAKSIAEESIILCFDEFQVKDIADAMILSRLFSELFALGVVVVATSNVQPENLYKDGIQREQFMPFIDVLRHYVDIVNLDAKADYRLQKIRALSRTYFTPLGEKAEDFLNKAMAEITNDAPTEIRRLTVQGRELKIQKTAGSVARFSFSELCEQPLAAADYIEIAKNFSTVIISDIPKIKSGHRDVAMRFTLLVDELYNKKVRLLCSAEVEPEDIYTSGDNAFEFRRTISRLKEMQSEAYLG